MLGHFAGMVAQAAITSGCYLMLNNGAFCAAAGVFGHEFIVEPFVNTLMLDGVIDHFQEHESESHAEHQHDHLNLHRISAGAIGAIALGQVLNGYTHAGHQGCCHQHHSWTEIALEGTISLIGSYIGTAGYDFVSENNVTHCH